MLKLIKKGRSKSMHHPNERSEFKFQTEKFLSDAISKVPGQFGTRTVWHRGQFGTKSVNGQFGTADNLAPRVKNGQFGTADNLAPRTIWHQELKRTIWHRGQFGTKSVKRTIWHQELKTDNLAPRVYRP